MCDDDECMGKSGPGSALWTGDRLSPGCVQEDWRGVCILCATSPDQLYAARGNQRPGPRGTGIHRLIQSSIFGTLSVCAAFARYWRTLNDAPCSASIARPACSTTASATTIP